MANYLRVNNWLRQMCGLPPWVFSIYMDQVVRGVYNSSQSRGIKIIDSDLNQWFLGQPLFVEDTTLVAGSTKNK